MYIASFDSEFCRHDYWKLKSRITTAHKAPLPPYTLLLTLLLINAPSFYRK